MRSKPQQKQRQSSLRTTVVGMQVPDMIPGCGKVSQENTCLFLITQFPCVTTWLPTQNSLQYVIYPNDNLAKFYNCGHAYGLLLVVAGIVALVAVTDPLGSPALSSDLSSPGYLRERDIIFIDALEDFGFLIFCCNSGRENLRSFAQKSHPVGRLFFDCIYYSQGPTNYWNLSYIQSLHYSCCYSWKTKKWTLLLRHAS